MILDSGPERDIHGTVVNIIISSGSWVIVRTNVNYLILSIVQ
jgi:hypothetical protein